MKESYSNRITIHQELKLFLLSLVGTRFEIIIGYEKFEVINTKLMGHFVNGTVRLCVEHNNNRSWCIMVDTVLVVYAFCKDIINVL